MVVDVGCGYARGAVRERNRKTLDSWVGERVVVSFGERMKEKDGRRKPSDDIISKGSIWR